MSAVAPCGQSESPFDAVMHSDELGEHTTGRELMPLLGYVKWERFSDAMDMAYHVVVTEQGQTAADQHFSRYREATNRGGRGAAQQRENVRLTRYAAYLTAMRGDSRKPEIRAALVYFAVQTRIAETLAPAAPPAPEPPAIEYGKPVQLPMGRGHIHATPHPDGTWAHAVDFYFLFGFRSSDELAAWLPESERRREEVPWGRGGTLTLWTVSEAGMARLLRERRPAPYMPRGSSITHEALKTWAAADFPALTAPARRELT